MQSNYIPWKGYFDLIGLVDEFILFDDMQYTRRDWRNRNLIKTADGLKWLTIPVEVKGKYFQKIRDTRISEKNWNKKHWASIQASYSRAPFFKDYRSFFEQLYLECTCQYLSDVNRMFLERICGLIGIQTRITMSMDYGIVEGKTERLVDLCVKSRSSSYLSGPSAKDYIDESLFEKQHIDLNFINYSGYPHYRQLFPPFEHGVSIIDLIFNEGPATRTYMKT